MEVKEIIENLKYNKEGKFQKESVLESRRKQQEVTEELLRELDKIGSNIEQYAQNDEYIFAIYAMYLLAEFKEKRAFPLILYIITNKRQDDVDLLLGDLITEDLKGILASTFDGDLDSLCKVITNLELNEYIRAAAFNSLGILQNYNILKQEQVIDIIEKMLANELKYDDTIVISDIVLYIAENNIYDKKELVKKLYRENRVDIGMIGGYDDILDKLYGEKQNFSNKEMIDDTIKSMSNWACFNSDDEDDFDFEESFREIVKNENKQIQNEINQIKKIGRNDLCFCGSGKKYKKCCMNKQETKVITPADVYIDMSLKDYPKEKLMSFYDDETIAIDEKLYKVLKHKAIPIWIHRNYMEEARRNINNMREALQLIKEKCKNEGIKTIQEFDEQIAIHYSLDDIIFKYFNVLDRTGGIGYEEILEEKTSFLIEIMQIFDMGENIKKSYIDILIDPYIEEYYFYKAKKALNRILENFPEMKKYINIKLSQILLSDREDIQKTLEPIEELVKEFGMDEELEIRKIEIYYEYTKLDYDYEEAQLDICQKLWQLVKDFISSKNIKKEEEFNKKYEPEYCFSSILHCIEEFYQYSDTTYTEERMRFLEEALNVIEIGEHSKEILCSGLTECYCDMGDEKEALNTINDFINKFPNNSSAILTKANIYSEKENPELEEAIKIIEETLNNNNMDNKYILFSKLALLYDECGNDEKASEYQRLVRQLQDEDLPF